MRSAIIAVGDEILIGQVTDTNSVWIAAALNELGVQVGEMVSISDRPEQIRATLNRFIANYDFLIMTGGLGPTKDDLTKQTLADYFGSKMVTDERVLERITALFRKRGWELIESNRQQADVPDACEVLMNRHGTAPGMWFEQKASVLVSLPGVPYEMKGIMEEEVIPRIKERIDEPRVMHRTVMTQGVPESYLAETLKEWEAGLPEGTRLAYLPRPGIVRLRLSVYDQRAKDAQDILKVSIDKLLEIIPEHVFGYDDVRLEKALGDLLLEQKLSVSTAESCTGGNVARLISSVPGASAYFQGAVVAYQNEIKSTLLKVDEDLIAKEGAVSRAVVEQMARGAMDCFGSDCSIALSGIAGPGGGSEEKPVGTVWIAVAYGEKCFSKVFRFIGTRERIIDQASFSAMQSLRRLVLGFPG